MRKLGLPDWLAYKQSYSRKGCMANAQGTLRPIITKAVLQKKGLLSLADHYQLVHC
jgi:hypothetical protein